jgi:hypothetical protein
VKSVFPVFIARLFPPGIVRDEPQAIQIRSSNELRENLVCQMLLGNFGSANRTAVIIDIVQSAFHRLNAVENSKGKNSKLADEFASLTILCLRSHENFPSAVNNAPGSELP